METTVAPGLSHSAYRVGLSSRERADADHQRRFRDRGHRGLDRNHGDRQVQEGFDAARTTGLTWAVDPDPLQISDRGDRADVVLGLET